MTPPKRAPSPASMSEALAPARAWNRQHGVPSSVVIIRRGYLVAEWHENGAGSETRFNIHSCTKSLTGTAYGMMFDDVRRGRLAVAADLDSPAYASIPAGHPLTDPRKERITLRHLLSMSSGIPGESIGAYGVRARRRASTPSRPRWASILCSPGTLAPSCGFPVSPPSPAAGGIIATRPSPIWPWPSEKSRGRSWPNS